jgi:hypothetical protein
MQDEDVEVFTLGENQTMNEGIEIIRLKKKGGKNDNN